jgi:cytochrome c-type biogenesis protein CcmH
VLTSASPGAAAVAARLLEAELAAQPPEGAAPVPPPSERGQAAIPVPETTVHEVAAKLRCVVCQNLSVADSPSEMANQMRDIVRQRLAAGETPEQVIAYFVERYGEWILLSPAPHGLNLLVWAAPAVAVLVGLAAVAFLIRRWTRPASTRPEQPVDPALRERVRKELELRR